MEEKRRVVITSGYFDPIHTGHIECLEMSKQYATAHFADLVVIVNNDAQAVLKKGKPFMCETERAKIVKSLRCVDAIFVAVDNDSSVCASIHALVNMYNVIAFSKGGDRFSSEVPEAQICRDHGIQIVDGLGMKIQSSSALIAAAANKDVTTPVPIMF